MRAAVLALAALAAGAPPAGAWGFGAHRLVASGAIQALPVPLAPFYQANAAWVREHSIDPDLEKQDAGDPAHFLDLDHFPAGVTLPAREADLRARYGGDVARWGRLPWRVAEIDAALVAAFRAGDPSRVLQESARLAHFAADAYVPLHAVTDFDGASTGQAGVHRRWEVDLLAHFPRQVEDDLAVPPAVHVPDPFAAAMAALRESAGSVPALLAADRACAGTVDLAATPADDRYGDAYFSCLLAREGAHLRERLQGAARLTASLWLSAWEEAGRPALDARARFGYVRGQQRAILVSLDGSSAPVIADAIARGAMPNLARVRAAGAVAEGGALAPLPSKTGPSHASLFTGTWPDRHGIGGNTLTLPGASILDGNDGFDSTRLQAEPLWAAATRQGLSVTVAQATQSWPFTPYRRGGRFGSGVGDLEMLDSYGSIWDAARAYTAADLPLAEAGDWLGNLPPHTGALREATLDVAERSVHALLYDDPADPTVGLDTMMMATARDTRGAVVLKPQPTRDDAEAFAGVRVPFARGSVTAFFRLFALSADGSDLLLVRTPLQHTAAADRRLGVTGSADDDRRLAEAADAYTGGMTSGSTVDLYDQGRLGPRLWEGGDGTAERRYLEGVALGVRQTRKLTEFAARHTRWDLLFTYLPEPDEFLHLWLGRLDRSLASHDPALAARLQPFLDRGLGLVDQLVGTLLAEADERTVLVVAGDHGLVATDHLVRPNVALRRAGLLAVDPDGGVDLAHTQAMYFKGNVGYVVVNSADRAGGIVSPAEEAAVRTRATEALSALRDPETGIAPVVSVRDAHSSTGDPAIGGPGGGDLYLSLAAGYVLSADVDGEVIAPSQPHGEHLVDPQRPEMHVAAAFSGAGVAHARLGTIRVIDIAPTLCALLGIDPPAQSTGKVLTRALARPVEGP